MSSISLLLQLNAKRNLLDLFHQEDLIRAISELRCVSSFVFFKDTHILNEF